MNMDGYAKLLLALIAAFSGLISAVDLALVRPAHAVSTNVAVDQIIEAIQNEHKDLAQLIRERCK
jgi:hypothetical protein